MPPREEPLPLTHLKYRPDIDGLRAIAVLSVVGYHAFPSWVPGGFTGVDIFFVISGYLISTIIFGSLTGNGFAYQEFYARRIRRIFPALILVMAVSLAFGWYVLLSDEFRQLGTHVLASAGFISNFVLWGEAGYFDTAAESKPLLHLWSLAVEEQFYIFWPLLLGLAWRRKGRAAMVWITAAIALSFIANVATVTRHPDAAFYLPLGRIWELAVGALLAYQGLQRKSHHSTTSRELRSIVGLILIACGFILIRKEDAFPGWWALLPVLGAGLCLSAGPGSWLNRRLLSSPVFVWFGLISYPLYLWHWPLLAYARVIQGEAIAPPRGVRVAAVLASVLLAWLTYRFLERRLRGRKGSSTVIGLVAAMIALALLGALALGRQFPPRNNDPSLQGPVSASSDWGYPDGLRPTSVDGQTIYRIGSGKERVLWIGDSHVEQFAPRAIELSRNEPDALATNYFATRGACPPVPHVFADRDPLCGERRDVLIRFALGPQIDAVVIGGCWTCYFDMGDKGSPDSPAGADHYYFLASGVRHPLRTGDGVPRSMAALESLIKSLRSAGKQVYLLLAIPVGASFEPRQLITGSRWGALSASRGAPTALLTATQVRLHERMKQLATDSGATIIDPIGSLCAPSGQCLSTAADGTPIYKDGVHLRASYVRRSATFLDSALTAHK